MVFAFNLLVILLAAVALTALEAGAYVGMTWVVQKVMGPPEEYGAFDWEMIEPKALQELIVRCVLAGAIPAIGTLVLGLLLRYGLGSMGLVYFTLHYNVTGVILVLVHYGLALVPTTFLLQADLKRGALLAAGPTVAYAILQWPVFLDLMR